MRKISWMITVLILLYAVHLATIAWLGLAPDEAYYWYWAKHLDWSYYDHPPMAACIMAFFAGLGGNREFFVRIGGLLSSVLVIGLIYLSCRRLSPENRDVPWEVIFVANITLLFAAGYIIQPPRYFLTFILDAGGLLRHSDPHRRIGFLVVSVGHCLGDGAFKQIYDDPDHPLPVCLSAFGQRSTALAVYKGTLSGPSGWIDCLFTRSDLELAI